MHTKKIQHFAEAAFWPAALLRRASVLAEGQNLGAGGIHFRRACEVLTVSIKITTPKGVVIFMCFVAEKDMRIFTCLVASWLVPQHQSHSVKYLDSTHPKI